MHKTNDITIFLIFIVILLLRISIPHAENQITVTGGNKKRPTPYIEATLRHASQRALINVQIIGNDLQSVRIEMTLKADIQLKVIIQKGTILKPSSPGIQKMIITEQREIELNHYRDKVKLALDAACANMQLNMPDSSDTLSISEEDPPEDLEKLLNSPAFQNSPFRIRQFAIWTITDNPPERNNYAGIGYFGIGKGPSEEEMAEISRIFVEADISLDKYHAFD